MSQEFKQGDPVQVRDYADDKWEDAFYVAYVAGTNYPHVVTMPNITPAAISYTFCRPMPIATDEEVAMLTDIEPTQTIETKLDNAITVMNGAIAHLNAEINKLKKQIK